MLVFCLELTVPRVYNDGRPAPPWLAPGIARTLAKSAGGATIFPGEGIWRGGREAVDVVLACFPAEREAEALAQARILARVVKRVLSQESVFLRYYRSRVELI